MKNIQTAKLIVNLKEILVDIFIFVQSIQMTIELNSSDLSFSWVDIYESCVGKFDNLGFKKFLKLFKSIFFILNSLLKLRAGEW